VAFAAYLVIDRYKRKYGSPPRGVYFNKIMSLLYRKAKSEGFDIKLPHCWYRYGDEVVKYLMPHNIQWNHEDAYQTFVSWQGFEPEDMSDSRLTKRLKLLVDELVDKYSEKNVNEAIEEVYSYAPFEFQRAYRKCKDSILDQMRTQVNWKNYAKDVVWPCFDSACASFPKTEFPEVADALPVFRRLMEQVLVEDASYPDYVLSKELLEEFWEWFCYFLRVHPSAYENVPRETIEFWRERLDWETERYSRILGDHVVQAASRDRSLSEDPLLGPVVDSRLKRVSEENDAISLFDDDFEGLDNFLRQARTKPSTR
jgi:hypothetical protein